MDTEVKKALDLRLAKGGITLNEYREMLRSIVSSEDTHNITDKPYDNQSSSKVHSPLQPLIVVDQDLSLFDDFLVHQGKTFSYSAIKSLSFSLSRSTVNFIPISNMSFFSIEFDNGHTIIYSTDTTFIRGQKSKLIEQAYQFLQSTTASQRATKVVATLKKDGYVSVPSSPVVRLYLDGTIEDENLQRLNLKESNKNNALRIGMNYGFALNTSYQPDEIHVYDKPPKFAKKKIIFTLNKNQDIFKTLIAVLARPQ